MKLNTILNVFIILLVFIIAGSYTFVWSYIILNSSNNVDQPERTCVIETELKQYDQDGDLVKTIFQEKCTRVVENVNN